MNKNGNLIKRKEQTIKRFFNASNRMKGNKYLWLTAKEGRIAHKRRGNSRNIRISGDSR